MKKILYTKGLLLALIGVMASCVDFVDPNIPYKDFDTGAYLRTIERSSITFSYDDINDVFDAANSSFSLILEAVDAQNGGTVESVEIRARHRRLIPGVGLEYRPVLEQEDPIVRTLSQADFAPADGTRFLRTNFTIPADEVLSALGMTAADVNRGDVFEMRLVLVDNQGRRFSNNNRSSDVAGGFFYDSPFQYNVNVVCPSDLGGTFAFTTTNAVPAAAGCAPSVSGEVTITPVAGIPGQYSVSDVSFGVFACAYGDTPPGGSVRLSDSCGSLSFTGTDKYGDAYDIVFVSNDGTNLTFNWTNTWGDGGTTTLTGPEGFWPANLRTD
ncbi:hypothetical protein KIH41_05545 [Litoribacter ruber]|uniref:DUF1735 domain-containing protein n=1 Tax=Litoribacter ruber TaxID=702568 RepID=A0AAP2CFM9_9BACT|nr:MULTISPECIES: hypothetical protein [Litoribacter]MBS9523097.1 hypothetical protein [Litoribacter alkaliphilus]MBT0810740.1 hypothetical protein [Litoribacter ruber]